MARYTGPVWKKSRRLNYSVLGTEKELKHRAYAPGQHGQGKKKSTLIQEEIEHSVNLAKWQAANDWAKKKGYIFRILTEKEIFGK